jgi:hypothetical protein
MACGCLMWRVADFGAAAEVGEDLGALPVPAVRPDGHLIAGQPAGDRAELVVRAPQRGQHVDSWWHSGIVPQRAAPRLSSCPPRRGRRGNPVAGSPVRRPGDPELV